ncbi:MAG: ferrous iron transport protein A [Verrucomicrobia bacterium]|nr:MAG: ferrous iron transport protein A [Verrucomicrobiota bacterium]
MQKPETITTLDALPAGHGGRLGAMQLPPAEQQRMAEMGLTAGTPVIVTKHGHVGGPLEIRVRGCKLSLRRNVARQIQVTWVAEGAGHG